MLGGDFKRMGNTAQMRLSGWGRVGAGDCTVQRPESPTEVAPLLADGGKATLIARGLGRSYGDPAVNSDGIVLDCSRLNCMISFDAATGVLDCESGVSLCEIIDAFLPRGFFLPVTPGTKFVTVGGAIACDVHGKNHHGVGSFGNFVQEIELLTPMGERRICTPEVHEDLFWATIGGVGLTGIILRAKVRLIPVETGYMKVDYHQCRNLEDMLSRMRESDHRYTYSVAWVDCLARGAKLGRGVLMQGVHAAAHDLTGAGRASAFPTRKTAIPIPVEFPGFTLNSLSIAAFNELFFRVHTTSEGTIVDYDSYFYPLDKLLGWNKMYGRQGFLQYQATVPEDQLPGIVTLLERLGQTRRASFLAVLKIMGASNPGWLSYPVPGYTLTLDLPNRPGTVEFLRELDRVVLDHGGKLYFAKDACALPETIARMYPRLEEFKALRRLIDPEGRLSSNLARRLHLVEDIARGR